MAETPATGKCDGGREPRDYLFGARLSNVMGIEAATLEPPMERRGAVPEPTRGRVRTCRASWRSCITSCRHWLPTTTRRFYAG